MKFAGLIFIKNPHKSSNSSLRSVSQEKDGVAKFKFVLNLGNDCVVLVQFWATKLPVVVLTKVLYNIM